MSLLVFLFWLARYLARGLKFTTYINLNAGGPNPIQASETICGFSASTYCTALLDRKGTRLLARWILAYPGCVFKPVIRASVDLTSVFIHFACRSSPIIFMTVRCCRFWTGWSISCDLKSLLHYLLIQKGEPGECNPLPDLMEKNQAETFF